MGYSGNVHSETSDRPKTCDGNVWIPVQDYKSLRVVDMICGTLVNTHTVRELLAGYILLAQPAELKIKSNLYLNYTS